MTESRTWRHGANGLVTALANWLRGFCKLEVYVRTYYRNAPEMKQCQSCVCSNADLNECTDGGPDLGGELSKLICL